MACIQGGKFGKLNKRVTFPEVLDMVPYMSGEGDKPPLYHLYAVVVHLDVSNASDSGHYICYIKNSLGHWYKIDDSKVKKVDLFEVTSQRAYMLFYARYTCFFLAFCVTLCCAAGIKYAVLSD
jgi:ubiquitin carboxyl-terminal hydrolase 36/42